jgi:hypothetical protein
MGMGRYKHSTTFIPTFGLLLEHATWPQIKDRLPQCSPVDSALTGKIEVDIQWWEVPGLEN